jgi:exosortase/archaeosortase family protein
VLLAAFGTAASISGPIITTENGAVEIILECTGIFPALLAVAAIVAFPSNLRAKLIGIVASCCALFVLNQMRILSLIYLKPHVPALMPGLHHTVWPAVVVVFTVALFILWAKWSVHAVER